MTVFESIKFFSDAKEIEIKKLHEEIARKQREVSELKDQNTSLKNQNFRLKERLKVSSDKYHALTKKKTFSGEFPSSATDA